MDATARKASPFFRPKVTNEWTRYSMMKIEEVATDVGEGESPD